MPTGPSINQQLTFSPSLIGVNAVHWGVLDVLRTPFSVGLVGDAFEPFQRSDLGLTSRQGFPRYARRKAPWTRLGPIAVE